MDLLALKRSLMPMRTSYSRRELYALGEPLGDSATYLKAGGGLILGDGGGGGGGGGQPANTTSAQTQTQDLPDWAKPYAQDVLSKGKAVTDVSQNPYQAYGGERVAGFSDLQKQSQAGAGNIQTGPQGFQQDVGGYMNPYMNQILAPRLAEANRQYDISGMQANTQATQAGAFGGGRQALMQAENERNRNMGLSQIYGQGLDTAFSNAQNQYNQGFGQNIQAIGLQNQMGAQQQAQTQKGLDVAQQDFLTQKNYPYQQLSYMANLVRGTPMGMNTQSQVYQAPPSTAQTIGSLGLGAYGLNQMFKAEGGTVKDMAGGGLGGSIPGGSVMSREYKEDVVDNIPTDRGLQAAIMGAQARGDGETELAARNEMNEDAAIRRGVSGQVPMQFADNMTRHANGGIVAFALGGTPSKSDLIRQSLEDREEQSPEDYLTNVRTRNEGLSSLYGPDLTTPFSKELAETREQYKSGNLSDFDKGMIALQMSGAAVDPAARGNPFAAIGLIAKVGGQAGAQLMAQNKQANRELLKSQAEMATAQQNRNEGRVKLAAEQEDKSQTRKAAAFEQKRDAASKAAELLSAEKRNEASVAAQMAGVNRLSESERKIADYERRLGRKLNPDEYLDAMGQVGAATYGVRHTGQKGDFERKTKVDELIQKDKRFETISLDLMRAGGKKDAKSTALRDDANNRLSQLRTEYETRYKLNEPAAGAGAPTGGAPTGGAKTPTPQAIEALRGDPARRVEFDRYYGPGSSAKYLGG